VFPRTALLCHERNNQRIGYSLHSCRKLSVSTNARSYNNPKLHSLLDLFFNLRTRHRNGRTLARVPAETEIRYEQSSSALKRASHCEFREQDRTGEGQGVIPQREKHGKHLVLDARVPRAPRDGSTRHHDERVVSGSMMDGSRITCAPSGLQARTEPARQPERAMSEQPSCEGGRRESSRARGGLHGVPRWADVRRTVSTRVVHRGGCEGDPGGFGGELAGGVVGDGGGRAGGKRGETARRISEGTGKREEQRLVRSRRALRGMEKRWREGRWRRREKRGSRKSDREQEGRGRLARQGGGMQERGNGEGGGGEGGGGGGGEKMPAVLVVLRRLSVAERRDAADGAAVASISRHLQPSPEMVNPPLSRVAARRVRHLLLASATPPNSVLIFDPSPPTGASPRPSSPLVLLAASTMGLIYYFAVRSFRPASVFSSVSR